MWITIFCFYLLGPLLQKHQELELKALMRILDSEKKINEPYPINHTTRAKFAISMLSAFFGF